MRIVIVGSSERGSEDDVADVSSLLDQLEARYGRFIVMTVMSHAGIGKIVKNLCSQPVEGRTHRLPFCEADIRVYAKDLNRHDMAQLYTTRNAMLEEGGDEFYSFPHPQRRAVIDELIERRIAPAQRPHMVFMPGDDITLVPAE